MRKVYKYHLPLDDYEVEMPRDAIVRHVGCQGDELYLWAEVDTGNENEIRKFRVFGTGHDINDNGLKYVGTAMMFEGGLVWHVYEEIE